MQCRSRGWSLEKERDHLQAHVTAREASEVTSRQWLRLQHIRLQGAAFCKTAAETSTRTMQRVRP